MTNLRIPNAAIFFSLVSLATVSFVSGKDATNRPMPGIRSPHTPFTFVENRGQADPSVRYIGAGPEFKAWFSDRGVVLRHGRTIVKILFEGDASIVNSIKISVGNPIGARANYMYGSDPRHWRTDLPLFASIRYTGLWPGVALTYQTEHNGLKAEYLAAPGAKLGAILLRFDGSRALGNASLDRGLAGGVLPVSSGQHLAEDHFADLVGGDARARKGRLNDGRAEVVGGDSAESSVERSDGGARRGNDHDIGRHVDLLKIGRTR